MGRSKRKAGSATKRSKKHEPKDKPEVQVADPRAITPNGRFIHKAMEEHKSPGSWRDYVLFVGDQMLDAWGTFNLVRVDKDGNAVATSTVALLHKRHLRIAIGAVPAARFWNDKLKRRTNHGAKDFHKGKQRAKKEAGS